MIKVSGRLEEELKMLSMLCALTLQVSLEEARAVTLPCEDPLLLAASSTGRFLVLAGGKKVLVLDGETLKPVREIEFECTAVGFDAKDACFYIAGSEGLRTWDGREDGVEKAVEGVRGKFYALALDGGASRLFGVEKEKLRSWRLKD